MTPSLTTKSWRLEDAGGREVRPAHVAVDGFVDRYRIGK